MDKKVEDKLTATGKIRHWAFHPSRPYFLYNPEGDGFYYYATEDERDKAVEKEIDTYLDDLWDDSVVHVMVGKITHQVVQTEREDRPDDVDAEGLSGDGSYWDSECEYKCNYGIKRID